MATENGQHIVTREEFLVGRTVESMGESVDAYGTEWTILYLDNGREIHIAEDSGWVLVEPETH